MSVRKRLMIAASALMASHLAPLAPAMAASTTQEMSDDEFDRRLREALMRNPQLIIEAVEAYRSELQAQAEAATEDAVRAAMPSLIAGESGVAFGATEDKANVVIVEFFDYHCGFCRRAMDEVLGLLRDEKKLRVVFQELPVLREESREAALAALAAAELGDDEYRKTHLAFMRHNGLLDEAAIERIIKNAGISVKKYKDVRKNKAELLNDRLAASSAHGQNFGVQGTPYFILFNTETGALQLIEGYQAGSIEQAFSAVRG
ncbi:MAG: thioredoxin domain-containing protein [Parvularculaceae bacterium]|nr:thioredoxin domain-containing protein [Parvularculaceae bacterium]